jgi:hypothetical protein
MTIDDLVKLYEEHRTCQKLDPKAHAMRVVVNALRDEIDVAIEAAGAWAERDAAEWFNEILGSDAGAEKASGSGPASVHTQEQRPDPQVAGGANTVDAQQCQTNTTPATDAAPAVCVWTRVDKDTLESGCDPDGLTNSPKIYWDECPNCSLPIKFTEVK